MKASLRLVLISILLGAGGFATQGQTAPLSEDIAATAMNRLYRDPAKNESGIPARWTYDYGVVLQGIEGLWYRTGDGKYFNYIQQGLDHFVNDDGTIRTYNSEDFNLDNILLGRQLLLLFRVTGKEKYYKAATLLREQLKKQPRTSEGGFWHKKIYPDQMWLDGIYMAEPFYAEYSAMFNEGADFDDIINQFVWIEKHTRDPKTGLLYHGWDESKKQRWADPATGHSPNFWGRAMGWYAMALVDTLEYIPLQNRRRPELVQIMLRLADALKKYQDPKTGLWYEVVDKGGEKGNYLEASASCMFAYAFAKGARTGTVSLPDIKYGRKAYQGILRQFVKRNANGQVDLDGTVSVAGLGGDPYRDGSYQYYLSEKVVTNDPKGVGAFLQAANEFEIADLASVGDHKVVMLDSFYNNERKKDFLGNIVSWHYKWEELTDGGYSMWGHIFNDFGVPTLTLYQAPTPINLLPADIYIIVDPDTIKETPHPQYLEAPEIAVITDWVKQGGVLVLMGNDAGNAEFEHFNQLAQQFGIHFNEDSRNHVDHDNFVMGKMITPPNNPIFQTAKTLYLKEISTLKLTPPAKPVYEDKGDVLMAVAKFGKGTVFAVGDPWFYNEYTDGRKLPPEYENYRAASDLTRWLIKQCRSVRLPY